jgi:predicted nucleic acid-binding protein
MNRCVLDTDILSEIIKGKNETVLATAKQYLREHGRFTTSAISVTEIVYGFRRMRREDRVAQFEASLGDTEVLAFGDLAARLAGRINADLERKGYVIGMPDVMIAGVALNVGLPVVTGNIEHFGYVRSVGYDLVVENWRNG